MPNIDYPEPFHQAVQQLKRLPGIGPRSAERIALWLVTSERAEPAKLGSALSALGTELRQCERCGFFATDSLCTICQDTRRSGREICVVERATDILPIERTGAFEGSYHALGGRLSPLEHVSPEDLRIEELRSRIEKEQPSELILALSGDVEGEATANYLAELFAPSLIRITRLAQGIPAGVGLEYSDQLTLSRALRGRLKFGVQPSG